MATPTDYDREVANTIRQQLGVWGLGVVGASQLAVSEIEGRTALTFTARLHRTGQTRVRKARVFVSLNAMDLYDVTVFYDVAYYPVATNVYADGLTAAMYRLDSEGF